MYASSRRESVTPKKRSDTMEELKDFKKRHEFHTHLDRGIALPDADHRLRLAKNPLESGTELPDNLPALSERIQEIESATDIAPAGPEKSLQSSDLRPALSFSDDDGDRQGR